MTLLTLEHVSPFSRVMMLASFVFIGLVSTDALAQAPSAEVEVSLTPSVIDEPALASRYADSITAQELAAHLYFFASDYFEGRETATRGQRLAAKYLASQYQRFGLTAYGRVETDDQQDLRRFYQPFDVYSNRLQSATIEARRDGEVVASSTYGPDQTDSQSYLEFGTLPEVTGNVVFAGYGIQDGAYDDYAALADAGVDLSGKWVLVLGGEPSSADGQSLLSIDGELTNWSTSLFSKFRAAGTTGRIGGLLIVKDLGPLAEDVGATALSRAARIDETIGGVSLEPSGSRRAMPPVYAVSSDFANTLLQSTGRTVEELKQEIDNSFEPTVMSIDNLELTSTLAHGSVALETENVVAVVEGSDPALKHEYVVLTSHYDHIGYEIDSDGNMQVYNGADDDGSGTVALLEIAEAFQRAKDDGYGPRRSVMFLNVTAEEKGLIGSRYYADHDPIVPLENTVANLNIDMLGRHDPTYSGDPTDYVYIIGGDLISQDIHDINEEVNTLIGSSITLSDRFNAPDDPNQFYRRSDHWNFGKHNIPFIFYFTGTHEDYHGLGDTPDKVDYPRLERISRLIFGTAWQLANQDLRPEVSGEGFN